MDTNNIVCPVDRVMINENRARITAFFVLLLAIVWFFTNAWSIVVFLSADFFLRALNLTSYSPLGLLSGFVVARLAIKNKPTDRAPKRFAAGVGFVFISAIGVALFTGVLLLAQILAGVLMIFASLEAFVGFCAGCHVYSLLRSLKLIA